MDASITPLRHGGLSLVQTTDFFYPLVEDPYMQGMHDVFVSPVLECARMCICNAYVWSVVRKYMACQYATHNLVRRFIKITDYT